MKHVTAVAILIFFSIFLCPFLLHSEDEGVVTAKKANVYSKPDAKSKAVSSLTKGEKVLVKDEKKDWYQIELNGKMLWIQ